MKGLSAWLKKELKQEGEVLETIDDLTATALDRTLLRFRFDAGFLPVRPKDLQKKDERGEPQRDGRLLETGDGRPWPDLSTGQKAQLALAWMLAQALVLREQLPHRLLLLDDTSTAFDLGNLARQATWLRQLAYNPDEDHRWQVFLASHHDEMTSRLVQLLRPPPGRRLRILEFTSWSAGRGPEVQAWTLEGDDATKEDGQPPSPEKALKLCWFRPPEDEERA